MPITSIRDRVNSPDTAPVREAGEPVFDLIELLFFAYRDFVGDADEALAKFGFGRAHHRVLHFVTRHPGMKVADLWKSSTSPNSRSAAFSSNWWIRAMCYRRKAKATAASAFFMPRRKAKRWL